jgi:hypothetical protein
MLRDMLGRKFKDRGADGREIDAVIELSKAIAAYVGTDVRKGEMLLGCLTDIIDAEVAKARTQWDDEHPPQGIVFDVKVGDDGRVTIPEATREKHDLYNKILTLQVVSQFSKQKAATKQNDALECYGALDYPRQSSKKI